MTVTVVLAETEADRAACYALRETVFIVEQNVDVALERDGLDDTATHLLARVDGTPAGTLRLRQDGTAAKVQRVCVLQAHRGQGVADALMRAALDEMRTWDGVTSAKLGAQTHAMGLYERFGFVAYGPVYDDADMPHRDMKRDL